MTYPDILCIYIYIYYVTPNAFIAIGRSAMHTRQRCMEGTIPCFAQGTPAVAALSLLTFLAFYTYIKFPMKFSMFSFSSSFVSLSTSLRLVFR